MANDTNHAILRTDGFHAFECRHCGDTYAPALPVSISMLVAMSEAFVYDHRGCEPRTASTGGDNQ